MKSDVKFKSITVKIIRYLAAVFVLLVVAGIFMTPGITANLFMAERSATMQTARQIGLVLDAYAKDHNGHYPEGKTSTEVFQQLIDEKYVDDSAIFFCPYLNLPGKVRPSANRLKPENVSWDVTCCVDASTPDGLPVVFLTGYTVTYQAGTSASLINRPPERTWSQWWSGDQFPRPFIAVCNKDSSARAILADQNGIIPNFIPTDFDPKGKTYRQLTP